AVHHGAEHAHVIGTGAVHAALGQFGAAKEVAAADDYAHFDVLDRGRDLTGDHGHDIGIDSDPAAAEDLAGELEQDPPAVGADGAADVAGFVNRGACHESFFRAGRSIPGHIVTRVGRLGQSREYGAGRTGPTPLPG